MHVLRSWLYIICRAQCVIKIIACLFYEHRHMSYTEKFLSSAFNKSCANADENRVRSSMTWLCVAPATFHCSLEKYKNYKQQPD